MIFHKRLPFLGALFLAFFTAGLPAQEAGSGIAEKYEEVERLIGILDYNQAINILVDIVKENPEEMEKAQNKIQEIREKKEEFNKKYEELIRVLFEENDYERGLQLIDELEELDKNPNPATEESIKDARIGAELIYFRLLFNETMDRAYEQILNGQYDQAVSTYLTGYNFHKRTYDERDYGDLIKGPVDKSLDELMDAAAGFLSGYEEMQALGTEPAGSPSADTLQRLEEARGRMQDYAALRNAIWHAGWTFRRQNELLGEISSEYTEDFFLSFAWRIVYGRTTVEQQEGLVLAMDLFWSERLVPQSDQLEGTLDATLSRARSAYNRGDWDTAQALYEEGEFWALRSIEFNRLWTDIMNIDSGMNLDDRSRTLLERYYNAQVDLRTTYSHAGLYAQLSQFNQRLNSYAVYNDRDFDLMDSRRTILEQEMENLVPWSEEWQLLEDRLGSDGLYTDTRSEELASLSEGEIRNVRESYALLRGEISLDMAEVVLAPLDEQYQGLTAELEAAREFLEGIDPGIDDLVLLYVYPERSLSVLDRLAEENIQLSREVEEFLREYREVQSGIPQKSALEDFLQTGEEILAGLDEAQAEYTVLSRRADQNLAFAERFLNEGEFRFDASENSLNRRDYSRAIQELTAAQDLFVQALSYNEDIISREETDNRIQELQERILAEENRDVIRFVRENVNEGKSLYLQGRYAQSEVVLLRAESRWFTTNTEPNSEISYWMNLVRAALSVESGRTIEDTEPLYAEMTQFLNLAFSNFEAGRALIGEGNVTDGLKLLDRADQNLNEILIPMPLNQAASVLRLRIQQLRDPDLFIVVFSERYNSAVDKLRNEPDEAYIELKDLAEIEPDYPGIGQAIYDAEILLGIRVPPPDPAALQESEELYTRAFAIVEGNVRSQFPVALTQLDRAIELNPENSAAIELKDRIQLDAGGQTTIVLSSAAQSQFKNAEEKYISGEYFEAYAIVQQLLRDTDNASYPPLQDLRRRIESKF